MSKFLECLVCGVRLDYAEGECRNFDCEAYGLPQSGTYDHDPEWLDGDEDEDDDDPSDL